MPTINRSLATLRISGEELDPDEVSALLGHAPDRAQRAGERIAGKINGQVRLAKSGLWALRAPGAEPADIDGQLSNILGRLTSDLSVWRQLADRFHMDLFCGLFMENEMEGLCISRESLLHLGERGIELALDLYAGDGDEASDAQQPVVHELCPLCER